MKFEITQTITQTISRIVEAKDKQHALAFLEDDNFIQDIEVQRMEQFEKDTEEWEVKLIEEESNAYTK